MFIQQRSIHKSHKFLGYFIEIIELNWELFLCTRRKRMASVTASRFRHCIEKLMIHSSLEWVSGCKVRSSGKCKLHCAIRWHCRVRLQRRQRRQLHIVMHEAAVCNCGAISVPPPPPAPPSSPPHTVLTRWIQLGHSVNTLCHTNIFSRFSLLVIKLNSKTKKNNNSNNNDGDGDEGDEELEHAAAAAFVLKHLLTASGFCYCGWRWWRWQPKRAVEVWSSCPLSTRPLLHYSGLCLLLICAVSAVTLRLVSAERTKRHTQIQIQIHRHRHTHTYT